MNFYHISLLLVVVLSAYSEGPQHAKPPEPLDSSVATVCSKSSHVSSGFLAPVLSKHEFVLPQNSVHTLPQHEVSVHVLPQNGVYALPQNEVFDLPQNGVYSLPQNEVFMHVLPQNGVFVSFLPQHEMFVVVLPQNEVLKYVPANCQLPCNLKNILDFVLDVQVKGFKIWTWVLLHSMEKLGFSIKIVMESLQHVLKMYAWSLSENQASVKFRCRLIELFLKQSLFRKHDFAICVYKLYLGSQKSSFWHLKLFPNEKNNFNVQIRENHLNRSNGSYFYGGGQALIFSSEELLPYASNGLPELQYKFLQYIKIYNKQSPVLADDEILCKIPLDVLAPKLTVKCAKEISTLHDIFMPYKIQLKNAQILLKEHKCQCGEFMAVFKPHKVASNSQRQKTWYQNNKEKCAEYNKQPESQASNKKSAHKYYWSRKDVKFRSTINRIM